MKKLKILSPYNKLLIIVVLLTVCYVIFIIKNNLYFTKYNGNELELKGIINNIKIDGNKLNIELISKEKVIINYYFNDIEEKEKFNKIYKMGDKIKVTGLFNAPKDNSIFNLFNYRKYLLSKKIYWLFNSNKIEKLNDNTKISYKIKNYIYNQVNKTKLSYPYIKAFIIGVMDDIENDVLLSYQIVGINHLLAVSGMHITILSSVILKILNFFSHKKRINYFITCFLIIIYSFLNNYTPSVLRASFMFIILTINKQFNLKIKTISIMIFLMIIFLLYNPYYIYNIGFLFSFIICFYLILLNKLINRYKNYFTKLFITSLISFLVSIPILINNFFEINLLTPLFNLFFIPFVNIIIFPLALLTFIFPILDNILYLVISLLEKMTLICSEITLFKVTLAHINILVILLYYLLITLSFFKKKLLFFFLILLVIHRYVVYFNLYPKITMIDIGQGDSILIELPHNKGNILIDTGGLINYNEEEWKKRKNDYSLAKNKIIPFLKMKGINQIDYLILSHGDYDHMGEAVNLVNNFKVEKVIFNIGEYNELETNLIKVLEKKKIPYYQNIKELNIDNNKLYFLNNGLYDNENDNSNVIYTELDNYKFLFMGDAGVDVEEDLLKKYNLTDIDILKVGHHGSKTSTSTEFINIINPKYSIISVGKNNRYGHPNNEVIEKLEDSTIYRTDQDGSITFKIKKDQLQIKTCAP